MAIHETVPMTVRQLKKLVDESFLVEPDAILEFNLSCLTRAEREHGATKAVSIDTDAGRFIFDLGASDEPGGPD